MPLLGQLARSSARRGGTCALHLQSAWRQLVDAQPSALAVGHFLSQARLAAAAGDDLSDRSQAGWGKWGGGTAAKRGMPEQPTRSTQEERFFRLAGRFKACPLPRLPSSCTPPCHRFVPFRLCTRILSPPAHPPAGPGSRQRCSRRGALLPLVCAGRGRAQGGAGMQAARLQPGAAAAAATAVPAATLLLLLLLLLGTQCRRAHPACPPNHASTRLRSRAGVDGGKGCSS